ncbi:MAG TPA: class I SAM-dependent methyltransferase [Terriglobales bacterium]|nr:class I SAM-dependent methyltransferase [Terriglobales bacterium]
MSNAPQPTPVRIFETFQAYQRTAALKTAIELDLFTAIGEGADTAAALAGKAGAAERGVRILCDFLTILGFLEKDAKDAKQGGRYKLAADSALFLDRRSPYYLGSIARFLGEPELQQRYWVLTETVRRGGAAPEQTSTAAEHPMWVEFARGMAPLMMPAAQNIAAILRAAESGPCKVLDIAAGHGAFGITLAHQNKQAEVTAVDWRNVLEVALENAHRAGLEGRYFTRPGSAFEVDFGSGYDVALLTNFLHHFDVPTNVGLLKKVHAALKPGGRAVVLEFVPNDDRVTPPVPAAFAMMMLGSTEKGDAYTYAELEAMARQAGFASCELHALAASPEHVVLARK